jgi:hypothetical protein
VVDLPSTLDALPASDAPLTPQEVTERLMVMRATSPLLQEPSRHQREMQEPPAALGRLAPHPPLGPSFQAALDSGNGGVAPPSGLGPGPASVRQRRLARVVVVVSVLLIVICAAWAAWVLVHR